MALDRILQDAAGHAERLLAANQELNRQLRAYRRERRKSLPRVALPSLARFVLDFEGGCGTVYDVSGRDRIRLMGEVTPQYRTDIPRQRDQMVPPIGRLMVDVEEGIVFGPTGDRLGVVLSVQFTREHNFYAPFDDERCGLVNDVMTLELGFNYDDMLSLSVQFVARS